MNKPHLPLMQVIAPEKIRERSEVYRNALNGEEAKDARREVKFFSFFALLVVPFLVLLIFVALTLTSNVHSMEVATKIFTWIMAAITLYPTYLIASDLITNGKKLWKSTKKNGIRQTEDEVKATRDPNNHLCVMLVRDVECLNKILELRNQHRILVLAGRAEDPSFLEDLDNAIEEYLAEIDVQILLLMNRLRDVGWHEDIKVDDLDRGNIKNLANLLLMRTLLNENLTNRLLEPDHELILADAHSFMQRRRHAMDPVTRNLVSKTG